jgi:hypothetical protein
VGIACGDFGQGALSSEERAFQARSWRPTQTADPSASLGMTARRGELRSIHLFRYLGILEKTLPHDQSFGQSLPSTSLWVHFDCTKILPFAIAPSESTSKWKSNRSGPLASGSVHLEMSPTQAELEWATPSPLVMTAGRGELRSIDLFHYLGILRKNL